MDNMDYKSNSNKSRQQRDAQPEKKMDKVVTGVVKSKKKSGLQKFASAFIPEDVESVKSYIMTDVIIPAVIDAIEDAVHIILRGESGCSGRRNSASKVSYRDYYRKENERNTSRRVSNGLDYDDIVFESRGDAERVLDAMDEALSQYGVVSVGDLYDLADIQTSNYAVNKYGWTNIRSAQVIRVRDGYLLKMPKCSPLD